MFAESFDPRVIAVALTGLVVPRLASLGVLHLLDEGGQLVLESCRAEDPAHTVRAQAFFGAAPVMLTAPYGPAAALATGRPQLVNDAPSERCGR